MLGWREIGVERIWVEVGLQRDWGQTAVRVERGWGVERLVQREIGIEID